VLAVPVCKLLFQSFSNGVAFQQRTLSFTSSALECQFLKFNFAVIRTYFFACIWLPYHGTLFVAFSQLVGGFFTGRICQIIAIEAFVDLAALRALTGRCCSTF
jgi:hypothetical protein